jgi:hypothetical protein
MRWDRVALEGREIDCGEGREIDCGEGREIDCGEGRELDWGTIGVLLGFLFCGVGAGCKL